MEFESLSSSPKAVKELNRLLGLQKQQPRSRKSPEQVISSSLAKSLNLSKRILKNLDKVLIDPGLVSSYKVVTKEFIVISEKILEELKVE